MTAPAVAVVMVMIAAEALAQVQTFLRATKLDRDLELKVLEVEDELERTVRIRKKFQQ